MDPAEVYLTVLMTQFSHWMNCDKRTIDFDSDLRNHLHNIFADEWNRIYYREWYGTPLG